jgi:hypothetical protein
MPSTPSPIWLYKYIGCINTLYDRFRNRISNFGEKKSKRNNYNRPIILGCVVVYTFYNVNWLIWIIWTLKKYILAGKSWCNNSLTPIFRYIMNGCIIRHQLVTLSSFLDDAKQFNKKKKKAIKPLNSNFVFVLCTTILCAKKECRLNRVVFQWNPATGIRDPIHGKGCDETSRRSGVPVKCFQTQLYNIL